MAARHASNFNTRLTESPNVQGRWKLGHFETSLNSLDKDFGARQEVITFESNGLNDAAAIGTVESRPCVNAPTDQNAVEQGCPKAKYQAIAGNTFNMSTRVIR